MTGIPVIAALLLGVLIGAVGHGPVSRWVSTLRATRSGKARRTGAPRDDSGLMAIFVTLHPAPWVLALGTPFLLYQLTLGPLPRVWWWLTLGMVAGAVMASAVAALATRIRRY